MKKTVLSGFILASLLLIAVLSGCKKEEATNSPSNVGTAILTGKVQAQLNLSNTGIEIVPAGTKIVAVISSEDLVTNPTPGVIYDNITYETTVDGAGYYTFSGIAAANQDVTVKLYPADFEYEQIQADTVTKVRKVFTSNPLNPTIVVIKGTTKHLDLIYN